MRQISPTNAFKKKYKYRTVIFYRRNVKRIPNPNQLLELTPAKETPYSFVLITTYTNNEKYKTSTNNFRKWIKASGGLKLINTKEFRTIIFTMKL